MGLYGVLGGKGSGLKQSELLAAVTQKHGEKVNLYPLTGTGSQLLLAEINLSLFPWWQIRNSCILPL